MDVRLFGLIKVKSAKKFIELHELIVPLIESFNGTFVAEGIADVVCFDEIGDHSFDAVVEMQFSSAYDADNWVTSKELRLLTCLRQEAVDLTLMRIAG